MTIFIRFICTCFLLHAISFLGITQNWNWVQQYGAVGNEQLNAIQTDSADHIFIVGSFSDELVAGNDMLQTQGGEDVFLAKLDATGQALWLRQGTSKADDASTGLTIDKAGNSYWIGSYWLEAQFDSLTLIPSTGSKAIFLTKYTNEGAIEWGKTISGSALKVANAITHDDDGNIYLVGRFSDSLFIDNITLAANGNSDLFLCKINSNGAVVWTRQAGTTGDIEAKSMAINSQEQLVVGGRFRGTVSFAADFLEASSLDDDVFIATFDSDGNALWGRNAGGVLDDDCTAIAIDDLDNIFATGHFVGVMSLADDIEIESDGFNDNFFVLQYSTDGTPMNARSFGSDNVEYGEAIMIRDDLVLVAGHYRGTMNIDGFSISEAANDFDGFLVGFNNELVGQLLIPIQSSGFLLDERLALTNNGKVLVAGNFAGNALFDEEALPSFGQFDFFVAELEEFITSTNDFQERQIEFDIFPNPTRSFLHIKTNIKNFQLQLHNSLGQQLHTWNNSTVINLNDLKSGVYFLTLKNKQGTVRSRTLFIQ